MGVYNPPPIPPPQPKKTISQKIWGWPVVGTVVIFFFGGGLSLMTSSLPYHVWIADVFFVAASGLFASKFLTWEDARQQEARKKRAISALVVVCTLVVLAISVGGNHYLNRPIIDHKLESEPTSAIVANVVELSFTADKPVKEKIAFVSNSAQTLKVYSVRQHFAAILPRNPDSLAWYINQKWDQFFSYQRLGRTMLIEPHVVSYIPTDPQHFEDWPVVTSAMIKRTKATGGVVSFVLMGLFQYTDTTGLHETDYCAIARGENGPVVDCNTHLGPSKPTPLQ